MAYHPAEEKYGIVMQGPLAVTRACRLCKWHDTRRKIAGNGRGEGMREGNKQRGRLIQHLKEAHPAEFTAAVSADKDRRAARITATA
jgi:hypothetical protein